MYSYYDINFDTLACWLTPRWLKAERFMILLRSCFYPLVFIHNAFIRYREAKLYEIAMNYQVCYMEAFLNDRFDFTQRRIYIEDAANEETIYIYTRDELNPLGIYRRSEDQAQPVYTRGETNGDYINDFIIWVPIGVVFDESEMRAMVATKLCGKRYKIELF